MGYFVGPDLGALALAGTAAEAANIGTVMNWNGVNIQGPILEGDAMSFVDTLVKLDPRTTVTIILNSPGGSVAEATGIIDAMAYANEN